jgi:hypothetical protein
MHGQRIKWTQSPTFHSNMNMPRELIHNGTSLPDMWHCAVPQTIKSVCFRSDEWWLFFARPWMQRLKLGKVRRLESSSSSAHETGNGVVFDRGTPGCWNVIFFLFLVFFNYILKNKFRKTFFSKSDHFKSHQSICATTKSHRLLQLFDTVEPRARLKITRFSLRSIHIRWKWSAAWSSRLVYLGHIIWFKDLFIEYMI